MTYEERRDIYLVAYKCSRSPAVPRIFYHQNYQGQLGLLISKAQLQSTKKLLQTSTYYMHELSGRNSTAIMTTQAGTSEKFTSQCIVNEILAAANEDKREQPWKVFAQAQAETTAASEQDTAVTAAIPSGTGPDEKVKVGGLADVQQLFFV